MRTAVLAALIAGLATGLGGAVISFLPRFSRKVYDTLLGFSAGVMLAAGFTLLWPAMLRNGMLTVAIGFICGAMLVYLMEKLIPHLEPHFAPELSGPCKRLGLLMAAALTLHHLPEGLAVGVAFAGQRPGESLGYIVVLAIGLQNIPEGLAVAMPLRACGCGRLKAIMWASLSGLTEPVAAALGYWFVGRIGNMVPFGLALAAGAMIFVASDQLIPQSRTRPENKAPSLGLISGFVLLAVLTKLFY